MLIYKCDTCKKEITDVNDKVSVNYSKELKIFYFCEKCAISIIKFLKRAKLIKGNKS